MNKFINQIRQKTVSLEERYKAFVQIYNVQVLVCRSNGYVIDFGKNCSNGKLTVLLSGAIDSGYYDVTENSNLQFWENYKRQYDRMYYGKHKDSINKKTLLNNLTDSVLF